MRILAIDHGSKHCGWAFMVDGELRDYGPIELIPAYPETLVQLKVETIKLIQKYQPDVMALEMPMHMRGGHVTQVLVEHYAACKIEGLTHFLNLVEVTPPTIKLHATGHGSADKNTVAEAVCKRFGVPFDSVAIPVLYKDKKRAGQVKERLYDVSDAIALGWAAWEIKQRESTIGG